MEYLKILGLTALSAMALMGFASSASATTLEVGSAAQGASIGITASLKSGTSAILKETVGPSVATCTTSAIEGSTSSPFTGSSVTGSLSKLTFENCARPITVHIPGKLEVTHSPGTTNGIVASEGAEATVGTPFGTVTCITGATTNIATVTGATTAGNPGAHAVMDVNAVLNCGFPLPSAKWEGTYTVTSPTGLGVVA